MSIILNIDTSKNSWIDDFKKSHSNEDFHKHLNNLLHLGYIVSKTTKINLNEDNLLNPINEKFCEINKNCQKMGSIEENIKEEIEDMKEVINSRLQTEASETRNQCDNLNNAILKLTGNISTSSLKGRIGEDFIANLLKHNFPDDTVKETNQISHESDIHLICKNFPTILVESKLYSNAVNTSEIEKFLSDLNDTGLDYGIFISLTSPIIKHRRLEYKFLQGKHIIFLPNAGFDGNNIIYAVIFLKEISKLSSQNLINKSLFDEKSEEIKNVINNFELSYNQLSKLKHKALDTKNVIDKQLLGLTVEICETELIMKNIVEDTKKNILNILSLDNYTSYSNDKFDELIQIFNNENKMKKTLTHYLKLIKDHHFDISISDDSPNLINFNNKKIIINLKIMKTKSLFDFHNGIKCEIKESGNDISQFNQILNLI